MIFLHIGASHAASSGLGQVEKNNFDAADSGGSEFVVEFDAKDDERRDIHAYNANAVAFREHAKPEGSDAQIPGYTRKDL